LGVGRQWCPGRSITLARDGISIILSILRYNQYRKFLNSRKQQNNNEN